MRKSLFLVTLFVSLVGKIAVACPNPPNCGANIVKDEVVLAGNNFQLTAAALKQFLVSKLDDSVELNSVAWESNTILIPLMSLGTDTNYLRAVYFSIENGGTRVATSCNLLVNSKAQDLIMVYGCSGPAQKAEGASAKLSEYAKISN